MQTTYTSPLMGKTLLIVATFLAILVAAWTLRAQPAGPPPRDFMAAFDQNGDGAVSRAEFPGPEPHFERLDTNGDGAITADEVPKGPPRGDFIAHFDENGDGKVAQDEFDGPLHHFTRLDQNGDGFIDSSEAPSGPQGPPNDGTRNDNRPEPATADNPTVEASAVDPIAVANPGSAFRLPDTGQTACYDDQGRWIECPAAGQAFFGQDAQYQINRPAYRDNGDGTVTDLVTGLMWQQTPGPKLTWEAAVSEAATINLAGYSDWRLPTIKELYSLIDFNGITPMDQVSGSPYINVAFFDFSYGDTTAGERVIDAQYWSSTEYVSTTMNGNATAFGVNFADGRIKGYPKSTPRNNGAGETRFVRYVRGNPDYGVNQFVDNGDGSVSDLATGLMWMQLDSGHFSAGQSADGRLDWQAALNWAENLNHAGYSDWRLPSAKELQSIVDYSRAPATTGSAAIDPLFQTTAITDANGDVNFPYFWTSTTHLDGRNPGEAAVYIAFGEALGYMAIPPMSGNVSLMDVHGAGAQRSDPKSGDPSLFPQGRGPQGDDIRIFNFVRCVRTIG